MSERKYEILYILDPAEEIYKEQIEKLKEQYGKIEARIIKEEEMGKRRLAYEIDKRTDGFYYLTQIEIGDFNKLQDFEHELKLNPNVIRYIKLKLV